MAHIGNSPASYFTAVTTDVFSANGTATAFTLSKYVSNLADLEIVVNNIQQNPYSGSYSVSNNTLTFSEAPLAGSNNVVVTYRQATIGSTIPTPNTVGNNALQRDLSLTGNTTTQHLVPAANITYDIGTSTMRYRDLYLSGNTINLGDLKLSTNGTSFSVANATGGVFASALGNTVITGTLTSNATTITGNVSITGTQFVNGVVTFANSTSNTIYIAANGFIGIGNSTPTTSLSLKNVDAAITLHGTRGSGSVHTIETSASNNENLAIRASTALYLSTNSGDRIIVVSNGNVGVANATPGFKLQVDGSVGLGGTEAQNRIIRIGAASNTGVYFGGVNINTINAAHDYDGDYTMHLNYNGYNQGTTRFRNLEIDNGKNAAIAYFQGSSKQTTFYGDVLPNANGALDLGSNSVRWRNIYTNDLHLSNDGKEGGNDIDGTTGDWTIQEGENNLYIKNNKNGKKFKIVLEEVV
jgi:hypothetical protein